MAKTSSYLEGAHVVVATPSALAEVLAPPQPQAALQHVKYFIVDEVDACFKVGLKHCIRS